MKINKNMPVRGGSAFDGKKYIYIIAWIVLGLLLSFIAHFAIEISYIKFALSRGLVPENQIIFGHGYCALASWLQALLLVLGIALGIFAGRFFWRVIYIEKRYEKKLLNKQKHGKDKI